MRPLRLLFIVSSMAFIWTACEQEHLIAPEDSFTELNLENGPSNPVEIPFKAKYHTSQADDAFTELCSFNSPTDFWGQDHQVGSGNATHLGNFTIDLEFCFHVVLDNEGQPDFAGGFGEFTGDENASFEANNGDLLFTSSSGGSLIPIQDEMYIYEFENVVNVTGGTGRFENATGEIVHYGLVRKDGSGTDHIQEGTIIVYPANNKSHGS